MCDDDSEGIVRTYNGGGLGDNCGEEGAHGAGETDMCVGRQHLSQINNPVTRPSECSLASVLQASTSHEGDGLAFQGESTATCTEDHEAKSRVIASTTQTCHLDGYGFGLAVHHLRHDDRVAVFCQHPHSNKKLDTPDRTNSTVGGTCVVGCATDPELASGDNFRALVCVLARTTALLSHWVLARLPGDALLNQHKPGTNRNE